MSQESKPNFDKKLQYEVFCMFPEDKKNSAYVLKKDVWHEVAAAEKIDTAMLLGIRALEMGGDIIILNKKNNNEAAKK